MGGIMTLRLCSYNVEWFNHLFNKDNSMKNGEKEQKRIKVHDLSESLNTSMVTIRKDLIILEGKRMLFRNHGGASLESPYVNDRSVSEKEFINASEKAAIGQQAANMIEEDQYIILADVVGKNDVREEVGGQGTKCHRVDLAAAVAWRRNKARTSRTSTGSPRGKRSRRALPECLPHRGSSGRTGGIATRRG